MLQQGKPWRKSRSLLESSICLLLWSNSAVFLGLDTRWGPLELCSYIFFCFLFFNEMWFSKDGEIIPVRSRAPGPNGWGSEPGFCSMNQLRVLLLSPGHDAWPSQGYPEKYVTGTHFFTWFSGGRETTCYKILAFRFFQLHVLSFTLHRLLEKLSSSLNPGDLDPGLQDIVEVRVSPITLF